MPRIPTTTVGSIAKWRKTVLAQLSSLSLPVADAGPAAFREQRLATPWAKKAEDSLVRLGCPSPTTGHSLLDSLDLWIVDRPPVAWNDSVF